MKPRSSARVLFAIVAPLQAFFRLQAAGGLVMIANAALALFWANSPLRDAYDALFHATIEMSLAGHGIRWTVHHFTNDALMTLFFVLAGLEIKRELALGELRTRDRAALPLIAALGGMLVPALIFLAVNPAGPGRAGWGVPMATDIAFALGCLSLVRRRVPPSIFVFLTALAIFDDLGAMIVIALFYGGHVDPRYLVLALVLSGVLVMLGRARVQGIWPYVLIGVLLWIAVLRSGLHATIAGVIVGLAMPTKPQRDAIDVVDDLDIATTSLRRDCEHRGFAPDGTIAAMERHLESVQSPLDRMTHGLSGVVTFGVVPLFALANAGVSLRGVSGVDGVGLGSFLGLVMGKPIGVLGATWLATRIGLAPRPSGATWTQVFAASLMAGIGFTMSLFIGHLGLGSLRVLEDEAKLGVLAASVVAALLGILLLRWKSPIAAVEEEIDVPVVLDVPRFARGYAARPCGVSGALVGRTLAELDARRRFGVTVIGTWRGGQNGGARKLEPIAADERMSEGDVLLAAGSEQAVEVFLRFAQSEDAA